MRVLVTGGAGFIGSHVCEALIRQGCSVYIIDDLNDFYAPHLKIANLEQLREMGPIGFGAFDICDQERVLAFFAETRPETVIHLAARAGVRPSVIDPLLYERVNVGGTATLLEAARRHGVRKFVFASSSSVYGVDSRVPFSEDDHLTLPVSPYAASKISGEKFCHVYSHLYGLSVVCLRFFTVYGPRQRPDLAIRRFIELIQEGLPIPVYGDGTARRDYTYVDDTVAGVLAAVRLDCTYEICNLGNSRAITLVELIREIEDQVGRKAIINRLPAQAGDVPVTCADITKAGRLLGYSPETPFADGIRKTVQWTRRLRQMAAAG